MNGSLSQFKATLRRKADRNDKRKIYKKEKDLRYSKETPEYNFPRLETQELEDLKLDIKAKLKSENRKNFLIVLFTSIVIAILIYFFVLR